MEPDDRHRSPRSDDEPPQETAAALPEEDEPLGQPDGSRFDGEITRSKRR